MTTIQTHEFRNLLLSKRQEALAGLGTKFDTISSQGRMPEEDQALLTHEEFVSVRLNRIEYDTLRRIDSALARLGTDEYGICQECGEAISDRRLRAIPWAELCLSCQERQVEEIEEEESYSTGLLMYR